MTVEAYAKVNLTLEVLGLRSDGYHDLRSVVLPVSLADTIEVERADGVSSDSGIPGDLCVKAAEALGVGARIRVSKRIPAGGGLGGGSADAAAVLVALNSLYGLGHSPARLAEIGAEVGSDVPALVLGGEVLMEGRGERVSPFTFHPSPVTLHLVLANPGVFCSTPKIFKAFKDPLPNRPEILYNIRLAMQSGDGAAVARALQNDLAATAMRLHPEIEAARRRLETAGCLGASMSGSGATVFGIARDAADAGRIARELEAEGLWSVAVESVR